MKVLVISGGLFIILTITLWVLPMRSNNTEENSTESPLVIMGRTCHSFEELTTLAIDLKNRGLSKTVLKREIQYRNGQYSELPEFNEIIDRVYETTTNEQDQLLPKIIYTACVQYYFPKIQKLRNNIHG